MKLRQVKKFESGVVRDPISIKSTNTIEELKQLTSELNISGMPVVDDEELKGSLQAEILDMHVIKNKTVTEIMTPRDKLITVKEGRIRKWLNL